LAFIIRIYHDARSSECQNLTPKLKYVIPRSYHSIHAFFIIYTNPTVDPLGPKRVAV